VSRKRPEGGGAPPVRYFRSGWRSARGCGMRLTGWAKIGRAYHTLGSRRPLPGNGKGASDETTALFKSVDAVSRPHINGIDQNDDQSERAKYAKHDLVAVGPVHCWSPTGISGRLAARSRFKRAVIVLRMLRRPVIDAKLRPNARPITTCGLPAAQSSSSRLSSSEVHGL
jgi:hypothetical protein